MLVLFIGVMYDIVLLFIMLMGMDVVVVEGKLMRREVKVLYWVLWQVVDEVNKYVGEWFGEVLEKKLKLSLQSGERSMRLCSDVRGLSELFV